MHAVGLRSTLPQTAAALVALLVCLFAYFLTGYLGSKLPGFGHSYWLADALLLAVLLLHRSQWWGLLLLLSVVAHVLPWVQADSLPVPLHWVLLSNEGVTFCVAGFLYLTRLERDSLERLYRRARSLPGIARAAGGALLSLGCLWVLDSQEAWQSHFPAANLVGFVTVTPAVMAWLTTAQPVTIKDVTGATLVTVLVAAICITTGGSDRTTDSLILYMLPVIVVWAGASFGHRALTTGLAMAMLLLHMPMIEQVAPLGLTRDQPYGWQKFLFVISAGSLILARLNAEHSARIQMICKRLRRTRMTLKRVRAHLRATTERQKLALRATDDVIFSWDVRGNWLRWSANGARFFDPAPHPTKAWRRLWRCIDEDDRDRVRHDLRRFVTRDEVVWQNEFILKGRDDARVPVRVRGILVRDAQGKPRRMIGALSDMTSNRSAKESARALARAARLVAIGEITAAITHEVSQPLGAILNNAETALYLLQRQQASFETLGNILEDIRDDDLRAVEVVRRTRTLLQDKEMICGPVNLNEVVVHAVDALMLQAQRRGIALTLSASSIPPVYADAVHLQQVVINLIGNALDATEARVGGAKLVEVVTRHGDGKVAVRVRDTGCGIAPAQLEAIFDSFHTSKPEGLGLGLSIARAIIRAHGGRIFAENNQYGAGATVSFEVPAPVESLPNRRVPEPQRGEC